MFYSQLILAKKGPLGTIWIAAHLERKLRKNQVTETNISVSVGEERVDVTNREGDEVKWDMGRETAVQLRKSLEIVICQPATSLGYARREWSFCNEEREGLHRDSILFPEAPIALRLSGHLLLGVVRIYSRKVNYLFHDCSEALTKIKQAFHSGVVDLPPESATAPFHAITLPENFDLDELEPLPDRESAMLNAAAEHHVTTRELITLQDPMEDNIYFGSQFGLDERFPEADMPRMALDFEEEEMEKEAREREQSLKLTLEEEMPPPVVEEQIDYDRMDQMDAMDMDQLQPMTPAPPSMMDLDEEMIEQPVEQPQDFEQLAPVIEEPDQLAPMVEEHDQPEPVREEAEQMEHVPFDKATDQPIIEAPSEAPEELHPAVGIEEQVEEAAAQEPVEEAALVQVPDDLVPAIEAEANRSKPSSPARREFDQEEVPEVETLRSAVDPPADQGPDLFAFEKETVMASENVEARDVDQQMEDMEQLVEDNDKMQELREESVVNIPGLTSPRRRPSLTEDDLPADDDVLATLLGGRSTPALRVMPTPSEEAPTRKFKRAPKPPPRKRKPVLDIAMVLHGDVMREQLANTDDIRRVRKKAPCTQRELWAVQRQSLGHQVFSEPSLMGVCNALRELYDRMLVTGEADLPLADPEQEVTPETTPEKAPPTPQAEVLLEEPVTEERRTPEAQPEEEQQAADEPAAEPVGELAADLPLAPETGAPVPTGGGTPLQPEHGLEEAQDLNEDPKELATEDLNKETATDDLNKVLVTPEVQPIEGVAGPSNVAREEEILKEEQEVELPVLETEPEVVSEPQLLSSAASAGEPILLTETETETEADKEPREEAGTDAPEELNVAGVVDEAAPMEVEVQVTELGVPASGEEEEVPVEIQPKLLEQAAVEAEEVAEAVAEGAAVVVLNEDGTTVIVLEDDGAVIEGPFPVVEVKEEVVEEEIPQAELGFLGEPRETVFLDQDDGDLHEEAENYDDSTKDATLQGLGGWSARTRAVGGYLQGVFETLNADPSRRDKDSAPKIGLDHTLRGKSRKEAARMFFETLVLKTKDYIDVDQEQPFSEIFLSARPKLMKASF